MTLYKWLNIYYDKAQIERRSLMKGYTTSGVELHGVFVLF